MEKAVKVLLADDSEHFGKPCAAIMRSHSLDVQAVTKDGRQLLTMIEQTRRMWLLWISSCRIWTRSGSFGGCRD